MSDALTQFAKHAVCASSVLGDAKTPKEPKLGKDRSLTDTREGFVEERDTCWILSGRKGIPRSGASVDVVA